MIIWRKRQRSWIKELVAHEGLDELPEGMESHLHELELRAARAEQRLWRYAPGGAAQRRLTDKKSVASFCENSMRIWAY